MNKTVKNVEFQDKLFSLGLKILLKFRRNSPEIDNSEARRFEKRHASKRANPKSRKSRQTQKMGPKALQGESTENPRIDGHGHDNGRSRVGSQS